MSHDNSIVIHNGKCMTVYGGNQNGSPVVIDTCDTDSGYKSQLYKFDINSKHIIHKKSGKCISTVDGSGKPGARLQIYDCMDGRQDQIWMIASPWGLINGTGNCLDMTGGNNNNGTQLQIYNCSQNNNNQKWEVKDINTPLPPPVPLRPINPSGPIFPLRPVPKSPSFFAKNWYLFLILVCMLILGGVVFGFYKVIKS